VTATEDGSATPPAVSSATREPAPESVTFTDPYAIEQPLVTPEERADLSAIEAAFPPLPPLARPPFVTMERLQRTVPEASRANTWSAADESLMGDWLDASRSRLLVEYPWGAFSRNLIVFGRDGAVLSVMRFDRAEYVALKDVAGDDVDEVLVLITRGMVMDGGPRDWEIHEANGRTIATIAKSGVWPARRNWTDGAPAVGFNRSIDFPRKGHMTVTTTGADGVLACGCAQGCPACTSTAPRKGDIEEYEYRGGRFTKVGETRGPEVELPCACGRAP
jgi:hypothetical protein